MGKFSTSVVLAVTILYCFYIFGVSTQTCKASIQEVTKRQMQGIAKCSKSLKFKNGKEKAAKSSCILKCVMKGEGVLNAEGQITREVGESYVASMFAEEFREDIVKKLLPCLEEHGPGMNDKDEFCKSYDPFIKCLTGKLPVLCASA